MHVPAVQSLNVRSVLPALDVPGRAAPSNITGSLIGSVNGLTDQRLIGLLHRLFDLPATYRQLSPVALMLICILPRFLVHSI